MLEQETFDEESTPTEAVVYYRQIKVDERGIPEPDETKIGQTSEIKDLINYINEEKLKYLHDLDEVDIGEIAYGNATDIIDNGPNIGNVKNFLANFCDSLQSKQRAKNKYAMLIYYDADFLLAHVKTERGMSIKEKDGDVELVRRFLDVDNILSAAYFKMLDGEIKFSHFTDTDSGSFRSFLGVTQKQFNYRRKSVQIICYYEGKTGVECKFEFSNNQLEEQWIRQGSLQFSNGKLSLSNGRSHNIKEIRWGRSSYEMPQNFMSEFKEHCYGLNGQTRRYDDLRQLPGTDSPSIYDTSIDIIDRGNEVVIKDDGNEQEIQQKGELPNHIHVIYASDAIKLSSDFASDIFYDLTATANFSLYHPSEPFASDEFVLDGLSLMNINEEDMASERATLLTTIHEHLDNVTGKTLSHCLGFIFLHTLSEAECISVGFKNGIEQLINVNYGAPRQHDVVTTKEQEGDGLIEYKDRNALEKEDPAASITDNIETESRNHDKKVFLWGIDEETRKVDGLRQQRWCDDRVSSVQRHVCSRLDERPINYTEFNLLKVPLNGGEKCVIAGILS